MNTQNIMLKIMGKKYLQFYTEKYCLSKPVRQDCLTVAVSNHDINFVRTNSTYIYLNCLGQTFR